MDLEFQLNLQRLINGFFHPKCIHSNYKKVQITRQISFNYTFELYFGRKCLCLHWFHWIIWYKNVYIGIINRVPPPTVDDAQTIEQYFNYRDPPVMALAAIYLIHLYSALPEYLMIGKKRLLNLFNIEEVDNFTWP